LFPSKDALRYGARRTSQLAEVVGEVGHGDGQRQLLGSLVAAPVDELEEQPRQHRHQQPDPHAACHTTYERFSVLIMPLHVADEVNKMRALVQNDLKEIAFQYWA